MKRISILLIAVLALVVSACAGDPASSATATEPAVVETPEPTATDEPSATPDASEPVDTTALSEVLPDEVNGMARVDVPGLDAMLAPALAAQGVDASEVEFVFASYGEGTTSVAVNAIRVPQMGEPQLELLARMMAGADTTSGVEVQTIEVGGKSVLQMTGPDIPGGAYMYFADGAVFTVISETDDLARQLLAELP